ncbi:MAG: hypothetical protein KGZ70_04360 [Hydrogenophaga sp.]|uniref:hypothetical protein n=1 Tax=Hydrogenophaga sp. TaxID=1904254 RepID=UPI001BBD4C03|nr:hypothetical protein [Hydrogenophaga sp.]MBS3911056.1 hypothetical protein [Hydrogenophaga sp.]MDP2163822.1 hypothetical protein [Hydrogenophaga sp.]
MQSPLKGVPLAPRHLVIGFLASVALGGALAAPAPPLADQAAPQAAAGQDRPAEVTGTTPGVERKPPNAHKHREVRRGPVKPERGNYQPVIPPKHVIIPK